MANVGPPLGSPASPLPQSHALGDAVWEIQTVGVLHQVGLEGNSFLQIPTPSRVMRVLTRPLLFVDQGAPSALPPISGPTLMSASAQGHMGGNARAQKGHLSALLEG